VDALFHCIVNPNNPFNPCNRGSDKLLTLESAICKPNSVFPLLLTRRQPLLYATYPGPIRGRRHLQFSPLGTERIGPLRGLAPREVYRDPGDYAPGGGLLHRRFILTHTHKEYRRFAFLWHYAVNGISTIARLIPRPPDLYPPGRVSAGTLPYGVRTFLPRLLGSGCPMTDSKINYEIRN
jgi:hypothetical protein